MSLEDNSAHDEIPELPTGIPDDAIYDTYVDKETGVLIPKKIENFEQYLVISLLRERRRDDLKRLENQARQFDQLVNVLTPLVTRGLEVLVSMNRPIPQYPTFSGTNVPTQSRD